jgi:hypothetical protein
MGSHKITGLTNGSAASDAAAFGQIPVPANGYGITGNTGSAPTPAVSLANAAGSLGSALNPVPNSLTTLLTTASLGIGTWLVNVQAEATALSTGPADISMALAVGTATATFAGPVGAGVSDYAASPTTATATPTRMLSISTIVTVTVAGTLIVQIQSTFANNWQIKTSTPNISANCTGYTAVRIA